MRNILDLQDRSTVERTIAAAIKDCIDTHGCITGERVASAAKRVFGSLKSLNKSRRGSRLQMKLVLGKLKAEFGGGFGELLATVPEGSSWEEVLDLAIEWERKGGETKKRAKQEEAGESEKKTAICKETKKAGRNLTAY